MLKKFLGSLCRGSATWLVFLALATLALTSQGADLNQNSASVVFGNNLSNMNVDVNSGGAGCTGGKVWDIVVGGCTTAQTLRTLSTTRSCSCTCSQGGTCTSQQSGTYPVLGWRLPPSGAEQISGNGATTWGSCVEVTNACIKAPIAPGTGTGTAGEQFYVTVFICNSSNANYSAGPLAATYKNRIIANYRSFNQYTQRCPELNGYVYWQQNWLAWAQTYASDHSVSLADAMEFTWASPTASTMNTAAAQNGENSPSFQYQLDTYCSNYATSLYGRSIYATYVTYSGDLCLIH
jgi:hypothetical protein